MSKPYVLPPEWWAFAAKAVTLKPAPAPPRILWPRPKITGIALSNASFPGETSDGTVVGQLSVPDDVAALIEEYRRVGVELLPAKTSDPDGPLVPLPAKPAPERVVPPLPFTAYQAMLRG